MSSADRAASPQSLASIRALERSIDEHGAERTVLGARLDRARAEAEELVAAAGRRAREEAASRRAELLAAAERDAATIRAHVDEEAHELRQRGAERDLTALLIAAVAPVPPPGAEGARGALPARGRS